MEESGQTGLEAWLPEPGSPFPEDLTATDWVEYLGDERPGYD